MVRALLPASSFSTRCYPVPLPQPLSVRGDFRNSGMPSALIFADACAAVNRPLSASSIRWVVAADVSRNRRWRGRVTAVRSLQIISVNVSRIRRRLPGRRPSRRSGLRSASCSGRGVRPGPVLPIPTPPTVSPSRVSPAVGSSRRSGPPSVGARTCPGRHRLRPPTRRGICACEPQRDHPWPTSRESDAPFRSGRGVSSSARPPDRGRGGGR